MKSCKVCHKSSNETKFREGRNTCRDCENRNRALSRSLNWDREKEYKQTWRQANKDKCRIYNKVDTANARSVDKITTADVKYILKRDNYQCVQCESRLLIELDHIEALDNGGLNVRSNLQVLCQMHNRRKSNKELGVVANEWSSNSWG